MNITMSCFTIMVDDLSGIAVNLKSSYFSNVSFITSQYTSKLYYVKFLDGIYKLKQTGRISYVLNDKVNVEFHEYNQTICRITICGKPTDIAKLKLKI